MNEVIDLILNRKSVRAYEKRQIPEEEKELILKATLRAPTACNMMLYSVIEVKNESTKKILVKTCDNQTFIAKAPLVFLFLADYQRWYDYFLLSGVEELCKQRGEAMRKPKEGDLILACCDAIIAAHTAAIAAESLGIGSCYIGMIMENYETHRELFKLPKYAFPLCLLCLGYPTQRQKRMPLTDRFKRRFIVFENEYKRFNEVEFEEMVRDKQKRIFKHRNSIKGMQNIGQLTYFSEYTSNFTKEINRAVQAIIQELSEE
jgi:FMN reductase (NADPH)/FMN reductase [NAD(P)H]